MHAEVNIATNTSTLLLKSDCSKGTDNNPTACLRISPVTTYT